MRLLPHIPILLLLCCAIPAGASGQDAEKALARLRSLTESIDSLRCGFIQTTDIPLFAGSVVSTGRLLFKKPDFLLWEYASPVPQGLVFSGGRGFRWEENRNNRAEFTTATDPIAGLIAAQMLAWIRFDRDWIESRYTIRLEEQNGLTLILTPKSADARAVLASLAISFADDGIARSIVLREAAGGSTVIRLHNVAINDLVGAEELQAQEGFQ
jgi:outer membrane lipoprotein carrier protein